jgi:hypothetical protein
VQEMHLFHLAPEVMHLNATFVGGEGWHLTVIVRAQNEPWDEAYRSTYSHLSTTELADVIGSECSQQLGLT